MSRAASLSASYSVRAVGASNTVCELIPRPLASCSPFPDQAGRPPAKGIGKTAQRIERKSGLNTIREEIFSPEHSTHCSAMKQLSPNETAVRTAERWEFACGSRGWPYERATPAQLRLRSAAAHKAGTSRQAQPLLCVRAARRRRRSNE